MPSVHFSFQIRQNYPAPVGFLQELDFCRIWKKCWIPARVGAEIRYSPTVNSLKEHRKKFQEICTKANFNIFKICLICEFLPRDVP